MKRNHIYKGVARAARRMAATCLLFFAFAGSAWAQSGDGAYVIKKSTNFLEHVKVGDNWVLQNATTFSPNCIWYSGRDFNISGTNHNYYFFDETGNPRYLAAPFQANGTIYLSTTVPETYLLSNPDMDYYFYDWDNDGQGRGVARGHQLAGITDPDDCPDANNNWDTGAGECWEVYWVGYSDATGWKLSASSSYDLPEDYAARYRSVQVTLYPTQVTNSTGGGLTGLSGVPASMTWGGSSPEISASIAPYEHTYLPAYGKYVFEGNTHYYYNNQDHTTAPTTPSTVTQEADSYTWTITGEGAAYLSFVNDASNPVTTSTSTTPTLYYVIENTTGHKTATVTLTVSYPSGATQTSSATVQVLTQCQNPANPTAVVTYEGVTISWVPTADSYTVSWQKDENGAPWQSATVNSPATSYTISVSDLEYSQDYNYKVKATCDPATGDPEIKQFHTLAEAQGVICGAVFGGGRMADVTGSPEVIIINADSISAVYGGNDIAGEVQGAGGSTITLGIEASNVSTSYAQLYNGGAASTKVRIKDVYGGGNGYYAYNGTSFVAASNTYTSHTVANGASVYAMTQNHTLGDVVWTNNTGSDYTLSFPSIVKTDITMTNDVVKVDSIFGGAKNAFLTATSGNASSITVNGGTAFAVFGGNNYGGESGSSNSSDNSKQYIHITHTTFETSVVNYNAKEIGRDFGIGYVFGGGNKVAALESDLLIEGGQCDTVFAGGNSADVTAAQVVVNCSVDSNTSGDGVTFGNTYSNAIASATSSSVTVKDNADYAWNGTGIYNVRTLFGGNNRAHMTGLPTVTLTSGSVGTVYGGGNAGNMLAQIEDGTNGLGGPIATDFGAPMELVGSTYEPLPIWYGTHVVMNHATMLVDYLYGGCQMSDVKYSAWVEIQDGHVGTVYGGCNISGDVGSEWRIRYEDCDTKDKYQETKGATYVKASGGTIHGNLFAGSNGFYHCNNGMEYISGLNFGTPPYDPEELYVGKNIPTHNETHVMVAGTVTVEGNVYAGGNMAYVGFIPAIIPSYRFREFVGLASVRMTGGTVEGDVYGGGNRASVFGSNEVKVSGGTIGGALYGGNDRAGQVAQISNRVFYGEYGIASDGYTNLKTLGVNTYVSVTGHPHINTVYGGGNGAYTYTSDEYCDITDQPVQSNTFVDINIDGYPNSTAGGYIATVYGGGNGVTVTGGITVLLNVKGNGSNPPEVYDHVGNIFGGNNQGPLAILPDIILMKGQANTVYGGCNAGAMTGSHDISGYTNVGSWVHLRPSYTPVGTTTPLDLHGTVSYAVYGGCRMNGVTNNSLVLVDGGSYPNADIFGGSDISGDVDGTSQVVVTGGTIDNAFGGGNGDYDYTSTYSGLDKPYTTASSVTVSGGTVSNTYAGGNACNSGSTLTNITGGTVTTGIYGGCNSSGNIVNAVEVNILGGQVGTSSSSANVHGGGYGAATTTDGNVMVNIGATDGSTYSGTAVLWGDVYGGSALGEVSASGKLTQVNFYKGTINGDVYGGGLGAVGQPAVVSSDVEVNIYGGVFNDATGTANNGSTGGGNIYGCNNVSGSPVGNVYVNIYATDHGADYENNLYPTAPVGGWTVETLETNAGHQTYAINQVFGGGNVAAYASADKKATVHVYNCDNTIYQVFGGGNAADIGTPDTPGTSGITTNTDVIIDGGRFHQVYGGGNGYSATNNHTNPSAPNYNPGANIYGTASSFIYAGLIDEVFGGANQLGSIDIIDLNISSSTACDDEVYGKVFGCANEAPYNRSVNTTVECTTENRTIGELYGGSNQAYIGDPANHTSGVSVTLNLYGGNYNKVFAGSKGTTANAADIYGNVTLNLYGGTVVDAFGGSDVNGNITGKITVNVLDLGTCALSVDTIFGASNETAYEPTYGSSASERISPEINVMYIANESGHYLGNVFGGGNKATVTANPIVNIGYDASTMSELLASLVPTNWSQPSDFPRAYVTHDVYGGGNKAAVTGNSTVNLRHAASHADNIFGGGNKAGVTNTVINVFDGTVISGIYGGCNNNGLISGDINVNIYGGTMGTSSTPMTEGIFGGGKGSATTTDGNITVTIGDGTNPTIYADVYGGSALGEVGASGKTALVNLKNGTVNGNIYGGGMGQVTPTSTSATVSGKTDVFIQGGTVTANVYGGCNTNGTVIGDITVRTEGGNMNNDLFGGGQGSATATQGNVTVTINGGTIERDVYGGSALGQVNNEATDLTKVTLKGGTVTRNLYGGGMGEAGAGNVTHGQVNGQVEVYINGGEVTNVFGCNNLNGAPKSTVKVRVEEITRGLTINGNVHGGGNQAQYTAPTATPNYPEVKVWNKASLTHDVFGGGLGSTGDAGKVTGNPQVTINGANVSITGDVYGGGSLAPTEGDPLVTLTNGATTKLFGGGKAADVTGNPTVLVTGGSVSTGVYGGNNTSGTVDGNTTVTLTGGTIGAYGSAATAANVHGGGYGQPTEVTGNVTVTFGVDNDQLNNNLILYGDIYGGSALGSVNTYENNNTTTTVNVYSGTIAGPYIDPANPTTNIYGGVYGGGLGDSGNAAPVNGKVFVNIGSETGGKASLTTCNVFGCNNQNGSPQDDVEVHVYQTAHTTKDEVSYVELDRTYAIYQVFGGGNQAHYAPQHGNTSSLMKTHVYIHNCDNTVQYVYGGGNAADAVGVVTVIQGGRFSEVYGGGNGIVTAANIGSGGIGLYVMSGNVGFLFGKSNQNGINLGEEYVATAPAGFTPCPGGLFVDSYFFGANEAEYYGDLNNLITCEQAGDFEYRYVYAGSRWGVVYGDINLTVRGGTIENLFGGSRGYELFSADVKKFPSSDYNWSTNPNGYPNPTKMHDFLTEHPEYYDHGGNINLIINGGTIGNVFGGCDIKGNVEGKITVTVCEDDNLACPLFIGRIFGASNQTPHTPLASITSSPEVKVMRGTVGGTHVDLPVNNIYGAYPTEYDGNVYGGGNLGSVTCSPMVIVGDGTTDSSVEILGNVYGGGNEGDIIGNPQVIIVPIPHTVTYSAYPPAGGTIRVLNANNETVSSGNPIGEGMDLFLKAIPDISGYRFIGWTVTNGTVADIHAALTVFTMGTGDATITANFVATEAAHSLTFSASDGGSVTANGTTSSPISAIGEGTTINIVATPDITHKFDHWQIVSGTGASIGNINLASTTFTMGTTDAVIKAWFVEPTPYTLTYSFTAGGSLSVNNNPVSSGGTISMVQGASINLRATPNSGYAFVGWTVTGTGATVANPNNPETTFTMGSANATITPEFGQVHTLTYSMTPANSGTLKITDQMGQTVSSGDGVGQGAVIRLKATPKVTSETAYAFKQWTRTSGDGTIADANMPVTTLTMGEQNTVIQAEFITAHALTFDTPEHGTIKVMGSLGQILSSPAYIGQNVTVNITATPADGYQFSGWTVTGNGTIANTGNASTTFTMGTGTDDATITATFTPVTPAP